MIQKDWMLTIDSSVCSLYVKPLCPKKGEKVSILLQGPIHEDLHSIRLVSFQLGREKQFPMTVSNHRGSLGMYQCELDVVDTHVSYYFLLLADDRAYYYSTLGVTAFIPPLTECFSFMADLIVVDWVGSSTCYQIFPDRFRNGNPQIGAKEGEYRFDGAEVTVHGFDETPLEFETGRCLDFFNGDLLGIEQSIDHFKALGVDVLYLNPIGASRTTHRYDCIDFFTVDEKLGGNEAYASLCKALHEANMRIIIDISINHTGTDHQWYKKALEDSGSEEASFYYINDDKTVAFWQDVPTLPQLNYTSELLRNRMYRDPDSVMRSFLKEPYLQDGWRLDVASEVGRRKDDQLCEEIWREVRESVKAEHEQVYLVGEHWVDGAPFLQGDMWDATMNYFGSSRPMRAWMGETDRFLSDGWGQRPKKTRAYSGDELAQALKCQLLSLPSQMLSMQFNLINSHDTPRLYANTAIYDRELYFGMVKLLYVLPGMPNIYYGEEIKLEGPNRSVESSRYPMQWDQRKWDQKFYQLYTSLGAFRKKYSQTLKDGAWAVAYSDAYSLVFARYDQENAIVCVVSRADNPHTICFDNARLQLTEIIESEALRATVSKGDVEIVVLERASALIVARRYT